MRRSRRLLARKLSTTRTAEMKYARALKRVMRDMHAETVAYLLQRRDANTPSGFDDHVGGLLVKVQQRVGPIFDRHARGVLKGNARGLAAVGVKVSDVQGVSSERPQGQWLGGTFKTQEAAERALAKLNADPVVQANRVISGTANRVREVVKRGERWGLWSTTAGPRPSSIQAEIAKRRDENIQLVVKAGREYADSVAEIFGDPENDGLRTEDLKVKLLARGGVSESRAELIARDQTLKLAGAITEIRQRNAGVDEYIWSTSLDERVRDEHAALEGERFSWSSPPAIGHPGQDFQCRCVAVPVVDDLEGL